MSIAVHLPHFEGPLPLLLYLIRKEEMDIFDIDIYLITTQYLEYIRRMKELDLETAGDFVAMAATLIQIKSQMLLPQYNQDGEVMEVEDPRRELVNRLLEYQRFQETSKRLYARPLLGRDVWVRGVREEIPVDEDEAGIVIEEGGLYALISHYRRAVRNIKKTVHRVATKTKSIASQILSIKDRLIVGKQITLRELLNKADDLRTELLITFLSTLELGKMGYVSVYQSEVYEDIYITTKKHIEGNVVERVQEYDSATSEQVAESLFEQDAADEGVSAAPIDEETVDMADGASDEEIAQAERDMNIEGEANV